MRRSTLPLFPSDDGWPYPDEVAGLATDEDVDLDALELRVDPLVFSDLTEWERTAVSLRYGLDGPERSTKELARALDCSHAEARDLLGGALAKLRRRLRAS